MVNKFCSLLNAGIDRFVRNRIIKRKLKSGKIFGETELYKFLLAFMRVTTKYWIQFNNSCIILIYWCNLINFWLVENFLDNPSRIYWSWKSKANQIQRSRSPLIISSDSRLKTIEKDDEHSIICTTIHITLFTYKWRLRLYEILSHVWLNINRALSIIWICENYCNTCL